MFAATNTHLNHKSIVGCCMRWWKRQHGIRITVTRKDWYCWTVHAGLTFGCHYRTGGDKWGQTGWQSEAMTQSHRDSNWGHRTIEVGWDWAMVLPWTMVGVHIDPHSQIGKWTQDIRISLLLFCRVIPLTRKQNFQPYTPLCKMELSSWEQ